jgi:hypothetical protein
MPKNTVHQSKKYFCCMMYLFLACNVMCTPFMVTVQTNSQEEMDALTALIDADAEATGSSRHVLGAIEATSSRVVDIDDPQYLNTAIQSVPTLSLLDGISFDVETERWLFEYETMRVDNTLEQQINQYYRVLYATKNAGDQNIEFHNDDSNSCLTPLTTYTECVQYLQQHYVIPQYKNGLPDPIPIVDVLTHISTAATGIEGINATLTSTPGSLKQILKISIPHATIRSDLAHNIVTESPIYGARSTLSFGLGLMFLPYAANANNALIFDSFSVVENSLAQLAILKQSHYSIANHVSFFIRSAQADARIKILTVEYLLDWGHKLQEIDASLNTYSLRTGGVMQTILPADCAQMQTWIDDLGYEDTSCIAPYALCEPQVYEEGVDETLQQWISILYPIPPWHTGNDYQFNTLLKTNLTLANDGAGIDALSTLNFQSSHAPKAACTDISTLAFDAASHVKAEIYRGHLLQFEAVSGSFTVFNDTSLSMAEALTTLVLRADDTPAALQYFQTYTEEEVRLDSLFMSHALADNVIPDVVSNTVKGLQNGRSELILDPELLQNCPMHYSGWDGICTTSHDYDSSSPTKKVGSDGEILRAGSSVYYVHQVRLSGSVQEQAEDIKWLKDNIFGESDPDLVDSFYERIVGDSTAGQDTVAGRGIPFASDQAFARKEYSSIYWIWPIFTYPNRPSIGLIDRALVSLAYSVGE